MSVRCPGQNGTNVARNFAGLRIAKVPAFVLEV